MEVSLLAFAGVALAVVLTPGPTVLLALANGSRFGIGAAGIGIAGAALSDIVLITAAAVGLGAVLAASAFWFSVVKWIGVVYLVWIGCRMLRGGAPVTTPSAQGAGSTALHQRSALFRKSFLVAVTNPKGYLFFTAFLPQFLDPSTPLFAQYATLAVIFVSVDIAAMALYAGLGRKAAHYLTTAGGAWLDKGCGGLLIALGGSLAMLGQDTR